MTKQHRLATTVAVTVFAAAAIFALGAGTTFAKKGAAVPSILDTDWDGFEQFKGTLKRVGKLTSFGTSSISIDGAGNMTYTDADGNTYTGTVVQNGKKITATLSPTSISDLEDVLATVIETEAALNGIDAGTVTVDIDASKLKIKVKLKVKRGVPTIQFQLQAKFEGFSTTLGPGKGKAQIKSILEED